MYTLYLVQQRTCGRNERCDENELHAFLHAPGMYVLIVSEDYESNEYNPTHHALQVRT